MIIGNFDNYCETLKFINEVNLFFQINVAVDTSSFSNIPAGVSKLEFEIEKIGYHQMHSLWTAMGTKYQPSIIYKLRLTIQGNKAEGFTPMVSQASNLITA